MKDQLERIKLEALAALDAADSPAALEELRVKLLGKKGELTAVLKQMGKLSPEERPVMGQLANSVRASIEQKLEERKAAIHAAVMEAKLASEAIDVTIPGETVTVGHQHPMNQVLQQIKDIFVGLGYQVVDGPEVELASYNFTRLNIEEGHPSRDRSDTFYFTDDDSVLLRTQTSPMQIRAMEVMEPPICVLAPGRVFRKAVTHPANNDATMSGNIFFIIISPSCHHISSRNCIRAPRLRADVRSCRQQGRTWRLSGNFSEAERCGHGSSLSSARPASADAT